MQRNPLTLTLLNLVETPTSNVDDFEYMMMSMGADPWEMVNTCESVFHIAVYLDRLDLVKVMVKLGTRVFSNYSLIKQPIAFCKSQEMAEYLIEHGAMAKTLQKYLVKGIGVVQIPSNPALFHSCERGNYVAIKALLDHGSSPNGDETGGSPLCIAIHREDFTMLRLLLGKKAHPKSHEEMRHMLCSAASKQNPDILETLLWAWKGPPLRDILRVDWADAEEGWKYNCEIMAAAATALSLQNVVTLHAFGSFIPNDTHEKLGKMFMFGYRPQSDEVTRKKASWIYDLYYETSNPFYKFIETLANLCRRALLFSDNTVDVSWVPPLLLRVDNYGDLDQFESSDAQSEERPAKRQK